MKKTILLFSALLIFGNLSAQDKAALVNPIIGTNGMGHTFPGACVPFGLVQLSPDTDTIPHNVDGKYQPRAYEYCAGYQHKDSSIVGFSHTHFSGTGHSDLGDILIMPATGDGSGQQSDFCGLCKTGRQPDVRRKSTETCCQKIKSVFTTEDYCAILKQYD